MLKTSNTFIKKATLQRVGNKLSQELNHITTTEIPLAETEEELLKKFFLKSIKSSLDLMKFTHHINLDYNTVYGDTSKYFENEISFIEYSNSVLHYLYEKSNHPQIKTGELFIIHFQEVKFQEILVDAIGIFKIENKIDFLKFNQHNNELDFNINKGVKLQKIDKGCLILQTDRSDGYRVFSIDNNSYDANYWKKSFLDIEEVMNDSYQTKHHLGMLSTFSNTMKDEKNTYVQKDFISQGIKLFNENEIITKDLIEQELLSPFDVVDSYSKFKSQYNKENNLDLEENFNVSTSTLKKEKKKIKSQINLDTKIQIKLDISDGDSLKENIEKGFDEERKMHFYKVFFNEET